MSTDDDIALIIEAIAAGDADDQQRDAMRAHIGNDPVRALFVADQVKIAVRLRATFAERDQHLAQRIVTLATAGRASQRHRTADAVGRVLPKPGQSHRWRRQRNQRGVNLRLLASIGVAACVAVMVLAYVVYRPVSALPVVAELEALGSNTRMVVDGREPDMARVRLKAGNQVALAIGEARTRYADGSTFTLSAGTVLTLGSGDAGKRIALERGQISADVVPQPAGRPLRITTPQGLATVVGTHFTLTAETRRTRLAVASGVVSLATATGDAGIAVAAGQQADIVDGESPRLNSAPEPKRRTITLEPTEDTFANG
ncbi:MAG TPA: FecR family protein, partial [Planctomycetota bacterium]|nr:FecR family protein [Planctomycetota bacterium]